MSWPFRSRWSYILDEKERTCGLSWRGRDCDGLAGVIGSLYILLWCERSQRCGEIIENRIKTLIWFEKWIVDHANSIELASNHCYFYHKQKISCKTLNIESFSILPFTQIYLLFP
jgi:hypothetical protein